MVQTCLCSYLRYPRHLHHVINWSLRYRFDLTLQLMIYTHSLDIAP